MTLNEPWVVAIHGYTEGYFPPGRTSQAEPYVAAHHLLRAHAYAVDVYRRKYQAKQKGSIGMVCNCDWREPATDTEPDREAAQRAVEFHLGWFAIRSIAATIRTAWALVWANGYPNSVPRMLLW